MSNDERKVEAAPTARTVVAVGLIALAVLLGAFFSLVALGALTVMSGDGVVTEVVTDKFCYAPGEPVNVTVVVTNHGSEGVTMEFPSSMIAYYAVEDADEDTVFDLRLHVAALTVMTYLTLGPGESAAYVFDERLAWQQEDDDGCPVARPDAYTIQGLLDTKHDYDAGKTNVTLVPAGDPGTEALPGGIITEVVTGKSSYAPGEPVDVTVVVNYVGTETVTMLPRADLVAYYVVMSGDHIVFNLMDHVEVSDAYVELTLDPGESLTFTFDGDLAWRQVDDSGNPVDAPDEYTIYGALTTCPEFWSWARSGYEYIGTTIAVADVDVLTTDVPEFSTVAVVAAPLVAITIMMVLRRRGTSEGR